MKRATEPALDAWVPKIEAAGLLGVGVRQLERIAARGFIESRIRRREMGRGKLSEYCRADLEAYLAGTPNVHAVPVPDGAAAPGSNDSGAGAGVTALVPNGGGKPARPAVDASAGAVLAALAGVLQAMPATLPAVDKPWLTLSEAVSYSGLPESFLRRAARSGAVFALNVGSDVSPRWRFNREGLARV